MKWSLGQLILFSLVVFLAANAFGQKSVCKITSLDEKPTAVSIEEDWYNRVCKIACGSDSITAYYYTGNGKPVECKPLSKHFLQVTYDGSGSNTSLRNVMILCADKGNTYIALHIQGTVSSDFTHRSTESNLSFQLVQNSHSKPVLAIIIDSKSQVERPAKNTYKHTNVFLQFDVKRKVFYQKLCSLNENYQLDSEPIGRKFSGSYPFIHLGAKQYYFMDGSWYWGGDGNELRKYSVIKRGSSKKNFNRQRVSR